MDDDRMEVLVLGYNLGIANGWDRVDDWTVFFYDFIPNAYTNLPAGGLQIAFETGEIAIFDDSGKVIYECKAAYPFYV